MSTPETRQHVHTLVDQLPPAQLEALAGLLETMIDPVAHSIRTAPVDDELVTQEEELALDRADAWLQQNGGRVIPHEEVLAEFGLSVNDFSVK